MKAISFIVSSAAIALAISAPVASAHGVGVDEHGLSPGDKFTLESEILGTEHAEEHLQERAVKRRERQRWERLTPAEQQRKLRREHQAALELARSSAARAPADEIGRSDRSPRSRFPTMRSTR